MPKPQRIQFKNAWYHVYNRANARKSIYLSEDICSLFLEYTHSLVSLFNFQIHAFCIMKNHYHLLINTPDGNLAQGMHHFGYGLSRRINTLINTDGPLFKSRYCSKLIDADSYLLNVSRYIHLNPVEAGLSPNAHSYSFSSAFDYTSYNRFKWLSTNKVLSHFKDPSEYSDYLSYGIDSETHKFYNHKYQRYIIGSPKFSQKIKQEHLS